MNGITIGAATTTIITHTANGLVRIPAMMVSITAAAAVGEIALRLLGATWRNLFGAPVKDSWPQKIGDMIQKSGVRPFGQINEDGSFKMSNRELVIKAIAFSVLSVLAFEAASFLCGPAPAIYNNVLSFIGPVRFDSTPYLQNVGGLLAQWGLV